MRFLAKQTEKGRRYPMEP